MTDNKKTEQLENRIDKLESTIEKLMPSRRDALKMGGAALAGGSLMAGTASAGTNQVGTIGSASQPVDIESEDINNADTVTTQTLLPEVVGGSFRFAGAYPGADQDARLDNALSAAVDGDTIFLENVEYQNTRTISHTGVLVGSFGVSAEDGSRIGPTWTVDDRAHIFRISIPNFHELKITASNTFVSYVDSRGIVTVNDDRALITNILGGDIVFASGTSDGLVSARVSGVGITDNGNNTIGTIG